jgi:radical SAM protein with 4Fe4S-binding SPASM domain
MEKKFNVQRTPLDGEDTSVYGFPYLWNHESIEKAIKDAEGNMPIFQLSKLEFHPSGYCNLKCPFCYGEKLAPVKRSMLPESAVRWVLDDIRANLPDENPLVVFAGLYSEPLTHPEIIDMIRDVGMNHFRLGFYTNGLLMDNEVMGALVENALKTQAEKPSFVCFNVTASLAANYFRKGLLPRISKLSEKRRGLEQSLQINAPLIALEGYDSYDYLKGIVELLVYSGVDKVRLSFPWEKRSVGVNASNLCGNIDVLQTFRDLEEEFPDRVVIRLPEAIPMSGRCYVSSMTASVSSEGDVYPCQQVTSSLFRESFSYGNILAQRFTDIWQSKRHEELFNKMNPRESRCSCCPVDDRFNELCCELRENSK